MQINPAWVCVCVSEQTQGGSVCVCVCVYAHIKLTYTHNNGSLNKHSERYPKTLTSLLNINHILLLAYAKHPPHPGPIYFSLSIFISPPHPLTTFNALDVVGSQINAAHKQRRIVPCNCCHLHFPCPQNPHLFCSFLNFYCILFYFTF